MIAYQYGDIWKIRWAVVTLRIETPPVLSFLNCAGQQELGLEIASEELASERFMSLVSQVQQPGKFRLVSQPV